LAHSPLKPEIAKGTDIIVVRELIGGICKSDLGCRALSFANYLGVDFGDRIEAGEDGIATDTATYSVPEIERITRVAAQCALAADPPLAVHSIDKANVLATSRLWRKTVTSLMEKEYPQLALDHHLVDSAAMIMVANPRKLNGVVVTENLFGDM
jgi:3-isopropylmalate dehydrogenase